MVYGSIFKQILHLYKCTALTFYHNFYLCSRLYYSSKFLSHIVDQLESVIKLSLIFFDKMWMEVTYVTSKLYL